MIDSFSGIWILSNVEVRVFGRPVVFIFIQFTQEFNKKIIYICLIFERQKETEGKKRIRDWAFGHEWIWINICVHIYKYGWELRRFFFLRGKYIGIMKECLGPIYIWQRLELFYVLYYIMYTHKCIWHIHQHIYNIHMTRVLLCSIFLPVYKLVKKKKKTFFLLWVFLIGLCFV